MSPVLNISNTNSPRVHFESSQKKADLFLNEVSECHLIAARQLCLVPMRNVPIEPRFFMSKVQESVNGKEYGISGGLHKILSRALGLSELRRQLENQALEKVIDYFMGNNVTLDQVLNEPETVKNNVQDMLKTQVGDRDYNLCRHKANHAVEASLEVLRPIYVEQRIKSEIHCGVQRLKHNWFLAGKNWNSPAESKSKERKLLLEHLHNTFKYSNDPCSEFLKKHPHKVASLIDVRLGQKDYDLVMEPTGSHFKSYKNRAGFRRLPASQIRSPSGRIYELLNTIINNEQKDLINKAMSVVDVNSLENSRTDIYSLFDSVVLGEGGFGLVRFARDLQTGDIPVVKKIEGNGDLSAEKIATEEWKIAEELRQLAGDKASDFMLPIDVIHLPEKSYLVMELAANGDGTTAIDRLHDSSPAKFEQNILDQARSYLNPVKSLHDCNIVHHDIKPNNFLHGQKNGQDWVKLADFGHSKPYQDKDDYLGTWLYSPPERIEKALGRRADKSNELDGYAHDSFSMGITLLEMKMGILPTAKTKPALLLNGQNYPLEVKTFLTKSGNEIQHYAGFSAIDTKSLKGETLDEVIAKLIDVDPSKRPSMAEVLKMPYFQS